nr:hypothetical protein [Tanacetum cinerariifolium]
MTSPPPPLNPKTTICFSFAAYAKTLISHLHHHSNIPIATGLTQQELTHIESTHDFSFPPDLRSILREGLPVGQGFPNWRASSQQQLDILINLPILGLCKEVHRKKFWHKKWGHRPKDDDHAVDLAKGYLKKYPVPVLVPVYRNCYVPASPCLSGIGQKIYLPNLQFHTSILQHPKMFLNTPFMGYPVWAATVARRVEFWSEMVELRRSGAPTEIDNTTLISCPKISHDASAGFDNINVCVAYGKVVDVFIPFKRSKIGKKFAFVRFIRVDNMERLIENLSKIWIGKFRLHANVVRFHRDPKSTASQSKINDPHLNKSFVAPVKNMGTENRSFASVLNIRNGISSKATESTPAIVLDDDCLIKRDFSCSLMGKIKDLNAIPNLYLILYNEGFENVKISHLGGFWVLLNMDSVDAKEKVCKHVGVGSWFSGL